MPYAQQLTEIANTACDANVQNISFQTYEDYKQHFFRVAHNGHYWAIVPEVTKHIEQCLLADKFQLVPLGMNRLKVSWWRS